MTPRLESTTSNSGSCSVTGDNNNKDGNDIAAATIIVRPPNGKPAWVRCASTGDFINPFDNGQEMSAQAKNERLNLNLGQRVVSPENKLLVWILRFLSNLTVEWWEAYFFAFWKRVPLILRRKLTFWAWNVYFPIHKALLGRRTGLHVDASAEYHALTTFMWWGRLFPVSVQRMRFSLSQLHVVAPTTPPASSKMENIEHDAKDLLDEIPARQRDFTTVKGLFMHNNNNGNDTPSDWTIFWVYGGAFLAGDTVGNTGPADFLGRACQMDVFLPEYRLVPEYKADDIYWDICLAYRWLCERRDASKIILLGISSGGALCTMLMQNLAKHRRGELDALIPDFCEPAVRGLPLPAGAVLFGPFVDFTEPSGSLLHHQRHDLIVNQRVLEVGVPYLETHVPDGKRHEYSPLYQSCRDLPPICIAVSEHETTFDMTVQLVNRARREGVSVTLGVWRYMCHVFSFFNAFCPEAQQSMEFCIEWMNQQKAAHAAKEAAAAKEEGQ